jgi:hypothetical protein
MHASPSAFPSRENSNDLSISFLWSPLLATAIRFESGAILQALISVQDHLQGCASWRVTRHADDDQSIVGHGSACSLDTAAAAAGLFLSSWTVDGALQRAADVRDPCL